MKQKAIVPLVLGLAIGLIAVKFGVDAIRRAQATGKAKQTVTVIQAKEDIDAHAEIRLGMVVALEIVETPLTPANERISDIQKLIGRVTLKAIPKNSPVLLSMLSPEGTQPGIIGRIPPGFRAVSVKIDEVTGVAYQLKPGVWVDVTVVMDVNTGERGGRGRKETIAEVILQRVQVAAIGYGTSTESEGGMAKVKPAKSATLFVAEEDVPRLHLAGTKGKITLALRGESDTSTDGTAIAYGREIGGRKTPPSTGVPKPSEVLAYRPEPEPEPEPPHTVLVMHRSSIVGQDSVTEQVTFENGQSTKVVSISIGAPTRAVATMRDGNRRTRVTEGSIGSSQQGNSN